MSISGFFRILNEIKRTFRRFSIFRSNCGYTQQKDTNFLLDFQNPQKSDKKGEGYVLEDVFEKNILYSKMGMRHCFPM